MKRSLILLLVLSGCATPVTMLKNKQGEVVSCGGGVAGSIAGGLYGYTLQESHDKDCVNLYRAEGYSPL